jgi:hypothetical protein
VTIVVLESNGYNNKENYLSWLSSCSKGVNSRSLSRLVIPTASEPVVVMVSLFQLQVSTFGDDAGDGNDGDDDCCPVS